jgi:hypothetical protein
MAAYRFIARHFGLKAPDREEPAELLSYDQTVVGLPTENLTILCLARQLAERREEGGSLRTLLRYRPADVARAWPVHNTKSKGLETYSYRIEFVGGLSASAVWLRAIAAPPAARATVILDDRGKAAAGAEVSDRVNRGDNVFAVDLLFHGDAAPQKPAPSHYAQMFTALGERPLAIQAAHLTALASWVRNLTGAREVRVETSGIRTQMAALTAAALSPGLFSEAVLRQAMPSLKHLFDAPVDYSAAPEPFCLDLYKHFDIAAIESMARPTRVVLQEAK